MIRKQFARTLSMTLAPAFVFACKNPDIPERTYYEQRIAPILDENCVRGTADGLCHTESEQSAGQALGNLDLSSFEAVKRRPELLQAYGSYPEPVLLLKAVKADEVTIQYAGASHPSEVFHAGGGILSRGSEAFIELQQWLKNGATLDGVPPEQETPSGHGECSEALRPDVAPFFDQAVGDSYEHYKREVEPVLAENCAFASCHGSSQSDFYLTCGASEDQLRHNYVVARSFVSAEADRSELLLRPLAPSAGGVNHSGGDVWSTTESAGFEALREWAQVSGPLVAADATPGFEYFAAHVMPVLLKRGCAMPQCHSPQGFNDFRLRAGSRGFFSPLALRRNYETTLHEFVSLDAKHPNVSRILAKNVTAARGGIRHRAGITLMSLTGEDGGGDPSLCPAGEDVQPTSYCTVVEWIRREREAAAAALLVSPLEENDTVPIVYVDRPIDADKAIEFANYRGDARLMRVDASVGALGALTAFSAPTAIDLSACTTATDYDVRGPEVAYDASRMLFALRAGEADGLNVYEADLDGGNCIALTTDGGQTADGVPVHNFDPVYVPDDPERAPGGAIVFASTRPGKLGRASVSPRWRLPASNLWRMRRDGSAVEQMTFLNGSEFAPAVMQNGQITMTTEKATADFYQLSGRRINWDLTDYHPLLAQRDTIGHGQATDIRESLDRNFLVVLSDPQARFSGGALIDFNRSIGPFEFDRRDEAGYVGAVRSLDPAASEAGKGVAIGAYRSPYSTPDGAVLTSYAEGTIDLTDPNASVDYDLVLLNPATGARTTVAGGNDGRFQVDGVVAYRRSSRHVFVNVPQLVFGGTFDQEAAAADEAWAHFPDLPALATLLTSNRRGQRDFDRLREGDTLAVYRAEPPDMGAVADGGTFERWELLGTHALEDDGSAFLRVPAGEPVVLELREGSRPLLTMSEEHQFGPGEMTSLGISRDFFDGVCGGCHGSMQGPELEVVVDPDALTGASISVARPDQDTRPGSL